MNIYTSVIDINKSENSELKQTNVGKHDENELKVLVVVGFIFELVFPKNRKIVQINLISENKEQGIESEIDEIISFNK